MKPLLAAACAALILSGCAAVKPYEREKLADPIMDPAFSQSKRALQHKFQSTREGAMGGPVAVGGGCGCAK